MLKRPRTLSVVCHKDQLIQPDKRKEGRLDPFDKDKAFYEIVAGGRGGDATDGNSSPDEWVINEDSVEVTTTIQGTSDPYRRFVLKRKQQELQGVEPTNNAFMSTALNSVKS